MMPWLLFVFIGFASFLLTGVLRRYALAKGLMDMPNERSSHSLPTPRGGGLAIVLTFLGGLIALKIAGFLPVSLFWALFGAGLWTAAIGWLDDILNLPARLRLAGHFAGAAWALTWLGGLPPLLFIGLEVNLGAGGHLLAAVYLVWLLNLYNFMDGINGLAGIQAVTVCAGAAVLYGFFGVETGDLWMVPMMLAAASVGFLFWNFPRARIFMGDAGSGFLGIVMGILSINAGLWVPELFWGWIVLMGAFVVDATATLVRRGWCGEKVYEAHRSHAYQHAAEFYNSHALVAIAFGTINIFWLLPIAILIAVGLLESVLGVVIGYTPLLAAALWFRAGEGQI